MKKNNKFSLPAVSAQIGMKLSELRIQKGYDSIRSFTEEFGLPIIQYWRIEKGKANLTLKTLLKLLAIHKISMNEFFCSE